MHRFALMSASLCHAVAQRDDAGQLFPFRYFGRTFSMCHCDPAGIQSDFLRFQHELLSVIPRFFIQIRALFPYQCDIIFNAFEFPVMRHHAVKTFRFVKQKLYIQTALPAAFFCKCRQELPFFRFNLFSAVLAHAVTRFHNFHHIHCHYSFGLNIRTNHTILSAKKFIGKENRDERTGQLICHTAWLPSLSLVTMS